VAEAVIEMLEPFRRRYDELRADSGQVEEVLAAGAAKARAVAGPTLDRAMQAAGLMAPAGGFS